MQGPARANDPTGLAEGPPWWIPTLIAGEKRKARPTNSRWCWRTNA